jgi:hypothetical protein
MPLPTRHWETLQSLAKSTDSVFPNVKVPNDCPSGKPAPEQAKNHLIGRPEHPSDFTDITMLPDIELPCLRPLFLRSDTATFLLGSSKLCLLPLPEIPLLSFFRGACRLSLSPTPALQSLPLVEFLDGLREVSDQNGIRCVRPVSPIGLSV